MAKYFLGNKILPTTKIELNVNEVDEAHLSGLIQCNTDYIISIKLQGLATNSLGYIFFVHKTENTYSLKDIAGKKLFDGLLLPRLVSILKHAAGIEYNSEIQEEFQKIRNEIGIAQ